MQRLLASILIAPLAACTSARSSKATEPYEPRSIIETRLANLERAAQYPWLDDGACVVREASGDWKMLVERCFHALDRSRVLFQDVDHLCPVAQVNALVAGEIVGVCLMIQPQVAVAAIVIIGAVIVAAAIAAEIEAAREKKPGCYCKCLNQGIGPYVHERVKNAGVCRDYCKYTKKTGGYECGAETGWFGPKVSWR